MLIKLVLDSVGFLAYESLIVQELFAKNLSFHIYIYKGAETDIYVTGSAGVFPCEICINFLACTPFLSRKTQRPLLNPMKDA